MIPQGHRVRQAAPDRLHPRAGLRLASMAIYSVAHRPSISASMTTRERGSSSCPCLVVTYRSLHILTAVQETNKHYVQLGSDLKLVLRKFLCARSVLTSPPTRAVFSPPRRHTRRHKSSGTPAGGGRRRSRCSQAVISRNIYGTKEKLPPLVTSSSCRN